MVTDFFVNQMSKCPNLLENSAPVLGYRLKPCPCNNQFQPSFRQSPCPLGMFQKLCFEFVFAFAPKITVMAHFFPIFQEWGCLYSTLLGHEQRALFQLKFWTQSSKIEKSQIFLMGHFVHQRAVRIKTRHTFFLMTVTDKLEFTDHWQDCC